MPLLELDIPMPFYVSDETVSELATQAQRLLKTKTKTEAIRIALDRTIFLEEGRAPLFERLAEIQKQARALGPLDPDFDQKAYCDEMWGND